jgi:serine/threonine-protein kinase
MSDRRLSLVHPGDTIEGRYKIVRALDEGGMGTVYLAEHVLIKRRVAIKMLHEELASDSEVVERFMNEARAAGTLGHPNIVESTDMGFTREGIPYIVFEFLEGSLLVDEVYRLGGMPVKRALKIAHQIASALEAAHKAGIVHRDLKSENIFLTDKDERPDHVKVLDFGISRFMELETDSNKRNGVMGTPEFMAPEQITDPEHVDRRADIYALGVILYEMLTARRPFAADANPEVTLTKVVHDPPPPLDKENVPPGLSEMIMDKLLAKDPAKRYQSMRDLQGALEAFFNIVRPTGSITPIAIEVPSVPAELAAQFQSGPVGVAPAKPSKIPLVMLGLGVLVVGAGVALKLAGGGGEAAAATSADPVMVAALQADADKISAVLDNEARAIHSRAESIASSPVLRAAIETDAATIRDLATGEHVFSAKPGEVIEIFQMKDGKPVHAVRLPERAAQLVVPDGATARVDTDGEHITITAGVPVTPQGKDTTAGSVVIASSVDLAAIQHSVGEHTLGATLNGLAKPIELVKAGKPGAAVTAKIPAVKDLAAGAMSIAATVATQAPTAKKSSYQAVSYTFLGIGGALLLLSVGGLRRARRER